MMLPWQDEQLVLVPAADAHRLCREGSHKDQAKLTRDWRPPFQPDGLPQRCIPQLAYERATSLTVVPKHLIGGS
jgi:hypothetical protein